MEFPRNRLPIVAEKCSNETDLKKERKKKKKTFSEDSRIPMTNGYKLLWGLGAPAL